jgi:hypothetical protein
MNLPIKLIMQLEREVFYENQSIRGLFDFEASFHNRFWNLCDTSSSS